MHSAVLAKCGHECTSNRMQRSPAIEEADSWADALSGMVLCSSNKVPADTTAGERRTWYVRVALQTGACIAKRKVHNAAAMTVITAVRPHLCLRCEMEICTLFSQKSQQFLLCPLLIVDLAACRKLCLCQNFPACLPKPAQQMDKLPGNDTVAGSRG